jgi:hypothetical protein
MYNNDIDKIPVPQQKVSKPPALKPKYIRYKVFGYWLLNQLKDKELINTDALTEIYNTIEFYSSVEAQTELYKEFDEEFFNESKKSMNKQIKFHNKPPKKETTKKTKANCDETKPTKQCKKKTQEVSVVAPIPENDPPAIVNENNETTKPKEPKKPKEKKTNKPKKTQPKELQPEELQPEELQPEELQPEELQPEELQPEELQPEELQQLQQLQENIIDKWLDDHGFLPYEDFEYHEKEDLKEITDEIKKICKNNKTLSKDEIYDLVLDCHFDF